MSAAAAPRDAFAAPHDPLAAAAVEMDRMGPDLAAALRRAVPFMVRRNVVVSPQPATMTTPAALVGELSAPSHVIYLDLPLGHAPGAIVLDAEALTFLLDGALGGDGSAPAPCPPGGLTAAQRALLGRILGGVVSALSAAVAAHGGPALSARRASDDDEPGGDPAIVLRLRLGREGEHGAVAFLLPRAAFRGDAQAGTAPDIDPRVAAALGAVELDVVVELGRVRIPLRDLAALQVGHVLTVPVAIGGAVPVRVGDRVLFHGLPTTSGSHLSVRLIGGTNLDAEPQGRRKGELAS